MGNIIDAFFPFPFWISIVVYDCGFIHNRAIESAKLLDGNSLPEKFWFKVVMLFRFLPSFSSIFILFDDREIWFCVVSYSNDLPLGSMK